MTTVRDRLLTMKATDQERQFLTRTAQERGTTVSQMIRDALERDGVRLDRATRNTARA